MKANKLGWELISSARILGSVYVVAILLQTASCAPNESSGSSSSSRSITFDDSGTITPSQDDTSEKLLSVVELEIFNYTNNERELNNLPPLAIDPACVEAAQFHASDMATRDYFSHDSPDESFLERLDRFGVSKTRGENIAYNNGSTTEVLSIWMNSSGHRANILSSKFTHMGVGHAQVNKRNYWVQCFSRP